MKFLLIWESEPKGPDSILSPGPDFLSTALGLGLVGPGLGLGFALVGHGIGLARTDLDNKTETEIKTETQQWRQNYVVSDTGKEAVLKRKWFKSRILKTNISWRKIFNQSCNEDETFTEVVR